MSVGRVGSLFTAAVLAAGVSMVATPAAFADGVPDCTKQAQSAGLKSDGPGAQACSYAKGGDTEDCEHMMEHGDGWSSSDEAANDACAKAAPAATSGGGS
jgi:hypothetical protein